MNRKEAAPEEYEVVMFPVLEAKEVEEIFKSYGLDKEENASVVEVLRQRQQDWGL